MNQISKDIIAEVKRLSNEDMDDIRAIALLISTIGTTIMDQLIRIEALLERRANGDRRQYKEKDKECYYTSRP